eukprot:Gb_18887 [translate_table: standard]
MFGFNESIWRVLQLRMASRSATGYNSKGLFKQLNRRLSHKPPMISPLGLNFCASVHFTQLRLYGDLRLQLGGSFGGLSGSSLGDPGDNGAFDLYSACGATEDRGEGYMEPECCQKDYYFSLCWVRPLLKGCGPMMMGLRVNLYGARGLVGSYSEVLQGFASSWPTVVYLVHNSPTLESVH